MGGFMGGTLLCNRGPELRGMCARRHDVLRSFNANGKKIKSMKVKVHKCRVVSTRKHWRFHPRLASNQSVVVLVGLLTRALCTVPHFLPRIPDFGSHSSVSRRVVVSHTRFKR